MGRTERIFTALGTAASIFVLVDRYFWDSHFVDALRIPLSIPIGVLAVGVFSVCALLLFANRKNPSLRQKLDDLEKENRHLRESLRSTEEKNSALADQVEIARRDLERMVSLPARIKAILAAKECDEKELMKSLDMSSARRS